MRRSIKSLLITSLVFTPLIALAGAANAGDPYGIWQRPSTGTQVRFYDCGGKLCGKVVAVREAARKKEIGVMIMTDAPKTGDKKWQGDMRDAGTGTVYSDVVVTLQSAGSLKVRGCVMMICRAEMWTRVK